MRRQQFTERVLIVAAIGSLVILLLLFTGHIFSVILIVIAAVLVAVFFDSMARWLDHRLPISKGWCKLLAVVGFLVVVGSISWALLPYVTGQAQELQQQLPQSVEQVKKQLQQTTLGSQLVQYAEQQDVRERLTSNSKKFFSTVFGVFGVLADVYIILFMGFLIYAAPQPYLSGIIHLVPKSGRSRAETVLATLGQTLRSWLSGKLLSMLIVAVLTWGGLQIIGLPFAVVLAILAGLLAFVPNFGPLIALITGVLIAATISMQTVLLTAAVYVGVQIIESNLLTPLIQRHKLSLPMAMVLFAQLVMGVFSGALGLILATPIFAIVMILVKTLYVEDALDDHSFQLEPEKQLDSQ